MAKIVSDSITITFSRLIKSEDDEPDRVVLDTDLTSIEEIVSELYDQDDRVVEVEISN